MKAAELRIGNIVYNRDNDVVCINSPILISSLHHWEQTKYSKTPPIDSIPLTEEWILKLGFKNNDIVGGFVIESGRQAFNLFLAQDTDWLLLYRDDIGCNYQSLIFIDYVHQLQNLYFALTNKELEL